jgi:D-arabinitol dehydrogenase (NADP+)
MQALYYNKPRDFEVKTVPIPEPTDDEILLKVTICGICGTDAHIHEGEFAKQFPLIPGHEAVGKVVKMGKNVKGFEMGDRCVADVSITCGNCFFCRRGESLFCENFEAKGVAVAGGFAEYITYHQSKVYKINKLTDEEATLLEPAACAVHGIDKLRPKQGIEVLLFGAGPTGLILAQLLKINGARRVVIASNKGIKMDLAKKLNAADEYVELERGPGAKAQWDQLRKDNPYGFDVVAECTGVEKLIDHAINYVRRGGSLLVYGVYEDKALVHWPPGKIFGDEINIIGSFSHQFCMPRAVEYLESGKINVKGMVTDVFDLKDYQKALDCMNSRNALKIAVRPPQ